MIYMFLSNNPSSGGYKFVKFALLSSCDVSYSTLSVTQYGHSSFADGSSLIMGGSRGETGGPDPLENHKNIVFFSNTGLDPLENLKATHVPSQH